MDHLVKKGATAVTGFYLRNGADVHIVKKLDRLAGVRVVPSKPKKRKVNKQWKKGGPNTANPKVLAQVRFAALSYRVRMLSEAYVNDQPTVKPRNKAMKGLGKCIKHVRYAGLKQKQRVMNSIFLIERTIVIKNGQSLALQRYREVLLGYSGVKDYMVQTMES